mmetsp:Transcript_33353/g.79781  ORF Transcript_33353/g.79781 Transcript_33353/m.79781 type:complete len:124 (-) Transcript_33353:147-518(-)
MYLSLLVLPLRYREVCSSRGDDPSVTLSSQTAKPRKSATVSWGWDPFHSSNGVHSLIGLEVAAFQPNRCFRRTPETLSSGAPRYGGAWHNNTPTSFPFPTFTSTPLHSPDEPHGCHECHWPLG